MASAYVQASAAVRSAPFDLSRRLDIDGLRAVAVLPVVAFHAFPAWVPGGFVGVDVFFVISGFLITGIILDDVAGFSLRRFYAHRIRRLFPALLAVLAFVLAFGWFAVLPYDLIRLGEEVIAGTAFAANFYYWAHTGYFDPATHARSLLHLWSLGVEEQFYLFWPIAILAIGRRPRLLIASIAAVAAVSFLSSLALAGDAASNFYLPVTRFWELMTGAALAWLVRSRPDLLPQTTAQASAAAGAGLLAIAVAIALVDERQPYPSWPTLLPVFGAAAVIWAGSSRNTVSAALSTSPFTFIGTISYPLYLWHWVLLWAARTLWPLMGNYRAAAICAVAVVAAWLTHQFIERPARSAYAKAPAKTTVALCLGAVLAAWLGSVVAVDGFPARFAAEIRNIAGYVHDQNRDYRIGQCLLQADQQPEVLLGCVDRARGPRIVLWGDSAAAAVFPGLAAENRGRYAIDQFTASACPPFVSPDYKPILLRPLCPAVNRWVMDRIRNDPPAIVVLSTSQNYSLDVDYRANLRATITALGEAGVGSVVVAGPPPFWPVRLPDLLVNEYVTHGRIASRLSLPDDHKALQQEIEAAISAAAADTETPYVSARQMFCRQDGCETIIAGEPTAADRFHLTILPSRLLAREIFARIEAARN